jgi:hypothetical protein
MRRGILLQEKKQKAARLKSGWPLQRQRIECRRGFVGVVTTHTDPLVAHCLNGAKLLKVFMNANRGER